MDAHIRVHNVELAKIGLGVSGGDVALLEMIRRLRTADLRHVLHTTASGHATFTRHGLHPIPGKFEYHQVGSSNDERIGVSAAYAWRTAYALRPPVVVPEPPSVVLSHSDIWPTVIYAHRLARRNNLPWIAWSHMVLPDLTRGYRGQFTGRRTVPSYAFALSAMTQRLSLRLMAKKASRVLTINHYTKKELVRRGITEDLITIIPYGADHLARPETGNCTPRPFTAVFVGRFHEQKGIMDLPDIWIHVRKQIPDARLAIVGDGPPAITTMLRAALDRRGLRDAVKTLGFLEDGAKTQALRASDLLVFPSYYESWGIAALEALRQGLPVVAYDLPVYEGLFNNGVLRVPIGSTEQFADAVVQLARDPKHRRTLGRAGREAVSHFRWADSAQQLSEEIHSVAK